MWVRGLKRPHKMGEIERWVAPYVGAWIETFTLDTTCQKLEVAPYVGAWIETMVVTYLVNAFWSRTLCGCVD